MKKHKLRNLDDNELRTQMREMDDQLFRLKFQLRMGQTDGLKKIRNIKKDRARIMTWLREKELAGAASRMTDLNAKKLSKANLETPGHKNEKVGEVVSTKMAKTIVVEVSRRVPHPKYKRIIGKRKRFYAHDEQGTAKMGDVVRIIECRPLSKLKHWRLGEVIRRAAQLAAQPKDLDNV